MHLFQIAFYVAGAFYALFIDTSALIPFFAIIALYVIVSAFLPNSKSLSIRKKIMLATWTHPSQGNIVCRVPVRVEKVLRLLESIPKQNRPSLTHFVIKAMGEVLASQPSLNGILTFGKFVPYETADVSCLVDIGGGKDLAMVCIKGVDKMSIEDIASFLKQKATKMKRSEGGQQHKNQMKPFKAIPAFLVSFLVEVIAFLACKLSIAVPSMKIQKHPFGAACVTALGPLGFQDAVAPFSGFTHCSVQLSTNAVIKQAVVDDGKVIVGQIMNSNFVVDHRYVDGGNCTKLVSIYRSIFQNPQKFMDVQMKQKKVE